jgi:hypothetical protein
MQRRLRVTLAATAAAGALALCTGTAYAEGFGGGHGYAASDHHDSGDCSYGFDKHQKALKADDFPSDHGPDADSNSTDKDAKDAHGDPYYTHNSSCDDGPREKKDHNLADTFDDRKGHFNTYQSQTGWDPKRYRYEQYGANRCQYDHLGSKKLSSDHDGDDHGDGGRGSDCQHHTREVREDSDRYDPDMDEVNGDDGYGHN